jgi:hypothetical protein
VAAATAFPTFPTFPTHVMEKKMRRRSPWGRWHEDWCAIFRGKSCDCDDNEDRRPRRRPSPLSGGNVPPKKRELELEEV